MDPTVDDADALAKAVIAPITRVITTEYPKLSEIWSELWDASERVKRKEILEAHLTETFTTLMEEIVQKESQTKEEYIARVESLLDEIGKLEKLLDVKISYNDVETLPLHLMAKRLNQKADRYREMVAERLEKLKDLRDLEAELVASLGALQTEIQLSEVPTESQLDALLQHVQSLEREKLNRMGLFMEKRQRIIEIYDQLGTEPSLLFEKDVVEENRTTDFKLSNENMEHLHMLLEQLEEKLRIAQDRRDQIVESLRSMWDYLEESQDHQQTILCNFSGCTSEHLAGLQAELERCKKEKSANIGKFVERIRSELSKQWDKCLVSDDVRNEFRVFRLTYYNEDIYDLHQLELDRWKKFHTDNHRIFELYKQHNSLFEKLLELNGRGKSANRYHNRGGQLLQEERQRKMVAKELPRVEEELRNVAAEFESKNGEPFTIVGENVLRVLDEKWEAHFDQKTIDKFRDGGINSKARTPMAVKRPAVPSSSTGAKVSRLAPTPATSKKPTRCARKLMNQDHEPDSTMLLEPSYDDFQKTFKAKLGVNKLESLDDSTVNDILNDNDPRKIQQSQPNKTELVDLSNNALIVEISDALSEKDKVKFTVHTKTKNAAFQKTSFQVVRQHEDFVWLHDRFDENPCYVGFIIPPAPPRPDFDASREKLQKLGEGEGSIPKEEFTKLKQELEAEYLATFKKTVAMHEVFLQRLANHPVFKSDDTFRIFLEYDQDLCVRSKNKIEMLGGLFSTVSLTTDEYLLSPKVKDISEFFEQEKTFLIAYHNHLKEATSRSDKMTRKHKDVADSYFNICTSLCQLSTIDHKDLEKFYTKVADHFESDRKIEARVASDEDLKLSDTLRYYMRDSQAAKRLLQRRLRFLADYENANRNLEKVRTRNKDVHASELAQQKACDLFEQISEKSKEELIDFKARRIADFRKNLVDLAELEIKHGKAQVQLLKNSLATLKEE